MYLTPRLMVLAAALLLLANSSVAAAQAPGSEDRLSRATGFVQCLVDGKFTQATAAFDAAMHKAMSPDQLQQLWQATLAQCGAFVSLGETRTATEGAYQMVFVACVFEQATLDFKLVYNPDDTIGGLWIVQHSAKADAQYSLPAYVHNGMFTERDVTVGSGEWRLPGTLAIPTGPGPFPALVLVQGSGPNDRDETAGANKPFRDLAGGLASRGVAVLRYDKRTKVYAAKLAAYSGAFTVQDEVIDDALAAVELLRHTEGIDPQRIFVLGHSLGGMLIPRIGQADPGLAGLIVMAGPTRPLEDIMLEQVQYLLSISGAPQAETDKQLDALRQQIATVKSPELKPATPASAALGAPGSYWLDLRGYNPAAMAQELTQPLLILQGGRDYQVTLADYDGWRKALGDKANVTFKLYADLNHLFMSGTGKSTPQEYDKRGPVPQVVIDDLAAWIKLSRG
jgi:uncharacterized protein